MKVCGCAYAAWSSGGGENTRVLDILHSSCSSAVCTSCRLVYMVPTEDLQTPQHEPIIVRARLPLPPPPSARITLIGQSLCGHLRPPLSQAKTSGVLLPGPHQRCSVFAKTRRFLAPWASAPGAIAVKMKIKQSRQPYRQHRRHRHPLREPAVLMRCQRFFSSRSARFRPRATSAASVGQHSRPSERYTTRLTYACLSRAATKGRSKGTWECKSPESWLQEGW